MAALKAWDTTYLKAQDPDQHASLAIAAVAIVDGAAPDYRSFKTLLKERIQSIPRTTKLLRTHPCDTTREWTDDPEFDVGRHLHHIAVPRPGDDDALFRGVAFALERPLDLDRPLWECWVIEGLKDKKWAILLKMHHCLADGISAAYVLTRLCDNSDTDTFGTRQVSPPPDRKPGLADALGRACALAGNLTSTVAGAIWPAGPTPSINRAATMRRYSAVRVPVDAVEAVCRKFGVTADDVALAAVTEGFRNVLLHRGEQPRADSLRTVVRPAAGILAMLPYLPVEYEDPIQRLRTVHDRLKAKHPGQHQTGLVESALNCLPVMLRSQAIQLLTRLSRRGVVTLATNVAGPRRQLRLMGRRLERVLPVPPTALALSSGVAILTYGDELVFGITADYDSAPDIRRLAEGIELEMARLTALSADSVLLFTKDRRRKPSRASAGHAGPSARVQARD